MAEDGGGRTVVANAFKKQVAVASSANKCEAYSVAYVHSDECLQASNKLPRVSGRADMVHSLIQSYGILRHMKVVEPVRATEEQILRFHTRAYVNVLQNLSKVTDEDEDKHNLYENGHDYGIGYDCPVVHGLYDNVAMVTGATLRAASLLNSGECKVAINWYGGWHHARRDEASGYCYINDIVLGILKLREKFSHILYIDLDLHHGDGVQDAFYTTGHVMTVSFHHYSLGFFPGTGALMDTGICRGFFHTINIPLKEGVRDYEFFSLFSSVMKQVRLVYHPKAVVCQCGADGLAGDPMDCFNLTHEGVARCVHFLKEWDLPLLILGGGGYHFTNTAISWTFITAVLLNRRLNPDIPDHPHFTKYGPTYELAIVVGNRLNRNDKTYLIDIYTKIMTNLKRLCEYKKERSEQHSHHIRL